jgi:tripartite-type tricarboxylate transporter receptor subunit TctC
MISLRHCLRALLLGCAVCCAAAGHAQSFPARGIRLIVPYAPGGIVDYVGRLMGQRLSEGFGQNVIVDNRPGAGGVIGIETASRANADGHTLVLMDPAIVINPSLLPKVPYDIHKDLATVAVLSDSPLVLAVNTKVTAASVQELVALSKKQPGKLTFASAGVGTTPHMAGEMLKARTGQAIIHVPYKGSGPAMTDLVGGQVHMTFSSITAALPFIQDGRLRGLATTGAKRAQALSSLPTMIEAGYPGFEVNLWLGLFMPAGGPPKVLVALNEEARKALKNPGVAAGFAKVGALPLDLTLQQSAAYVRSEHAKWAKVVREGNLRAD